MTKPSTTAIVAAAMAWAQADEQRRNAARVKRQVRDRINQSGHGIRIEDRIAASIAAARMQEKANREERAARLALLKACNPKPVTLKAGERTTP